MTCKGVSRWLCGVALIEVEQYLCGDRIISVLLKEKETRHIGYKVVRHKSPYIPT